MTWEEIFTGKSTSNNRMTFGCNDSIFYYDNTDHFTNLTLSTPMHSESMFNFTNEYVNIELTREEIINLYNHLERNNTATSYTIPISRGRIR